MHLGGLSPRHSPSLSLRLLSSRPSRLTLACLSQTARFYREQKQCRRNHRSRQFSPAMLCCADHISTIPPTITSTTSPMQPGPIISPSLGIDQRAGESQLAAREGWREGGRKGEGGFYHVSKVGGKAFCSARNMTRAAARMEQSLTLAGTFPFVNVPFYFFLSKNDHVPQLVPPALPEAAGRLNFTHCVFFQ